MATERIEMEPLYERDYNAPQEDMYVCSATGLVCKKVSKHFREYRAFIKYLSETNDDRLFLHNEPNLCANPNYFGRCSVYDNMTKKIAQMVKGKSY